MIFLKIVILLIFGLICYQDYKDRMVYWFLYPLVGLIGFFIQAFCVDYYLIFINTLINLLLIGTILTILFVYSKFILKKKLINEALGIGDVLLFISLCFCFSIISFFILFTFSLLFALLLHLFFTTNKKTIPLAGYMAAFFAFVYGMTFFVNCNFIFAY